MSWQWEKPDSIRPRKVSCVCTLFLKKGGSIHYSITGRKKYSVDFSQENVRVECTVLSFMGLIFCGALIFVVKSNHKNFYVYGKL